MLSLLHRVQERAAPLLIRLVGPRRFHDLVLLSRLRAAHTAPAERDDVIAAFHLLSYHSGREATWFGVPIAKLPFDCWVYQEIITELRPDLIIETGTYLGGSALFFAHLLELLGHGRVVTIDVRDWPTAEHPRITRIIGSSTSEPVVERVREMCRGAARVLVVLDSEHSAAHVARELRLYAPLVSPGSYIVVEDTNVNGHPVLPEHGPGPYEAVEAFLSENPSFFVDESREKFLLTYSPRGYLRRR